jgi:hypothetical protein
MLVLQFLHFPFLVPKGVVPHLMKNGGAIIIRVNLLLLGWIRLRHLR